MSLCQCVAVWYGSFMHCSVWQCVALFCSVVQCCAVWFSVAQCVAVCCSNLVWTIYVLQCVAVCCSVFQQFGVDHSFLQQALCDLKRTLHILSNGKYTCMNSINLYIDANAHTHARTYERTHARTHACINTRTHTCTHTHTHINTRTHAHTRT